MLVRWCWILAFLLVLVSGVLVARSAEPTTTTTTLGVPTSDVLLANRGTYVLSFVAVQGVPEVQVVASIFYGRVDMYAAMGGRDPSTSDYDLSSATSGMPDLLVVPTPTAGATVKVLVRASGETKLRLLLAAPSQRASPLSLGVPQREFLEPPAQSLFSFTPATAAPFSIAVTLLSSADSAADGLTVTVTAPVSKKVATGVSSEGAVSMAVLPSEVGKAFAVAVQGRVAAMFVVTASAAGGSVASPQQLLAGLPQQGFAQGGGAGMQFFSLQAGPTHIDVDITCVPLRGDVRLLVNADDGEGGAASFYTNASAASAPASAHAFPGATWATASSAGAVSLRIATGSPGSLAEGGRYLITVVSAHASSFLLRGGAADTITTLAEGFPVSGQVPKDGYRYFRFFDQAPATASVFDLVPSSGDADLFVGCRCLALGTDAGFPSRAPGHYNFSSQRWQEDAVQVPAGDARSCSRGSGRGVFYLSVLGFGGASDFTLSAMHLGGTRTLTAGQPVEDTVYKNIGAWFRFRLGMEAQRLSISLTPVTGDADLFVRFGAQAQVFAFDYRSSKLGGETDSVVVPEEDVCTDCWVSVLVFGYTTSRFMLVFALEETTLQLRDGMPQKGSVARGDYQYFTLQLPAQSPLGPHSPWLVASIVVTVFSGSPVLVASTDHEFPTLASNLTSYVIGETTGNIPVLVLPTLPLGVPLYIGVGGADSNASFTVRASVESMSLRYPPLLQLLEGVPQLDSMDVDAGEALSWRYYQIGVQAGHNTLKIRTVDLIGEVDVYVSRCPFATAYQCEGGLHSRGGAGDGASFLPNETWSQWSTLGQASGDSLSVARNDQGPATYLVAVQGQSYFSAYTIAYSFADTVLALQAGVPVQDSVRQGHTDYYSFAMPPQQDGVLKVTVTRLTGDPDVFVSTLHRWPSSRNSTWRAVRFGSDVLVIDPSKDTAKSVCFGCTYYIGVMGATDATYALSVSLDSTSPRLMDGVPLSDSVVALAWNYYQFSFTYGAQRDFRVQLSASSGRPSLFLTLDGRMPSLAHFQYSDAELFGSGQLAIQVQHTDASFIEHCGGADASHSACSVRVGVLGLPTGASYWLALTTVTAATLLQLDSPVASSVAAGQYALYRVALHPEAKAFTLRFALTAQTGRLTLFASCSFASPNATHHQWSAAPPTSATSSSALAVTLDIASADAADEGCGSGNPFYLSVYGGSLALDGTGGSFSLLASLPSDLGSVPLLLPGVPATAQTAYLGVRYFYVRPGQAYEAVRLSASCPEGGGVDLYVGASFESKPLVDATGRVSSYLLASAKGQAVAELTLSNDVVQGVCAGRRSCYLVVAVVGAGGRPQGKVPAVPFSFTLVAALADTTTLLQEGVPQRGSVSRHSFAYYSFPVTQPQTDVTVAVTALSEGDPDVYIGLGMHPTRTNFTFSSSTFGRDALTVQAADLQARGCHPDPSTGAVCHLFVGIYGWTNVSFSVSALHDRGFATPLVLLDGQPQNGQVHAARYSYFRFFLSGEAPQWDTQLLPTGLTVTLTPTGHSDLDLYLSFGADAEPGKQHSDYKSTKWSAVSETISVSAAMPHFCLGCWVSVAVFGYEAGGSFSIVASSSKTQSLTAGHAAGGSVDAGQFRYYSFFSGDSTAAITLSLTVLAGDADIYVSTFKPSAADGSSSSSSAVALPLPTRESFVWRSMHYGDDSLTLQPSDPFFCAPCLLLVGVLGYKNTSYTLLATQSDGGAVRLVYSRAQVVSVSQAGTKLFSVPEVLSDEDIVTFSLTALGSPGLAPVSSGQAAAPSNRLADLFLQVRPGGNSSAMRLDPADPSTYSQSTLTSMDAVLVFRAADSPQARDGASFLLAVVTHSALRYSIVARSASSPVMLQPGVPQQHFVSKGHTALFSFLPTADMQGVRISAVARTGDPDLVVSQDHESPHCAIDDSQPLAEGETSFPTVCSDYTWSSRSFSNDQIILSKDAPCEAIVPSTFVVPTCDPASSFVPGDGRSLNIGVFGYDDTKFTVLAAAAGQHVLLLPGVPVKSATALGFLCSARAVGSGACAKDAAIKKRVQVAYFTFSGGTWAPSADGVRGRAATISVVPSCAAQQAPEAACMPGCDCAPLVVFANSCARSKCREADMMPSPLPGQSQASLAVTSGGGRELVLGGEQCVAGEECLHYLSVVVQAAAGSPGTTAPVPAFADTVFTITARASGDVVLVPCEAASSDGVRFEAVDASPQLLYELCGAGGEGVGLTVAAEQCTGSSSLFACTDVGEAASQCRSVLPTADSWAWRASSEAACIMKGGKKQCVAPSPSSPHSLQLSLPRSSGSYFLLSQGTADSSFALRVVDGPGFAPLLVLAGAGAGAQTSVEVPTAGGGWLGSAEPGTTARLTWQPSLVLLPGRGRALQSQEVTYSAVFVLDPPDRPAAARFSLSSHCGLQAAVQAQAALEKGVFLTGASASSEGPLTYSFDRLLPRQRYLVAVVASCDAACLRLAAKIGQGQGAACLKGDCHTVHQVYQAASFTTGGGGNDADAAAGAGAARGTVGWAVGVSVLVVALLLCGMAALFVYWQRTKRALSLAGFDEMEMVDTVVFQRAAGGPATPTPDAADMNGEDLSTSSHPLSSSPPPSAGGFLSMLGSPPRRRTLGERLSLGSSSAGGLGGVDQLQAAGERVGEWAAALGRGLAALGKRAMDGASSSGSGVDANSGGGVRKAEPGRAYETLLQGGGEEDSVSL